MQLWFFTTDGRWLKSKPLELKGDGSCSTLFDVPPKVQIASAAITIETDRDTAEPQGPTLLTAELPPVPK
ncbi:MAG: hypothetical protein WD851_21940 [Pirellulales bacterium]